MTTFVTSLATSSDWTEDIIYILRALIGDPLGTVYTDERLRDIVIISAHLISKEFILDVEYTVDLTDGSISSDPDTNFKNITALRSAVIILTAEAKDIAKNAIRVKDGPSEIETGRGLFYVQQLLDQVSNQYAVGKATILAGQAKLIITPFTQPATDVVEPF